VLRSGALLAGMRPEELSMLCYVLARQRHEPPADWTRALLAHSRRALPGFTPRQASDLLSSLAQLRVDPGDAWLAAAAEAAARWPECSGKSLAKLLWALGKFGSRPGAAWCCGCLAALEDVAAEMDGGSLSMAVWGLGKLGLQPGVLQLDLLAQLAQQRLPALSSRELQRLVWGLDQLMQQQGGARAAAGACASGGRPGPGRGPVGSSGGLSLGVWVGLVRELWARSMWLGEEERGGLQPLLHRMMDRLRLLAQHSPPAGQPAVQ
jgi:hypothetical protein